MLVELLYFDGCPTWRSTLEQLRSLLAERSDAEEVHLVRVSSRAQAQRLRFPGSPAVRVDGVDVEPDAPTMGFGMECRVYWVDGRPTGSPPVAWMERALRGRRP